MIATGAPAEFGRTAGGVVNVITKSGTNQPHGSLFYFQRHETLTSELSDGTHARQLPPRAVGRHVRRAAQERQGVLLRRARRDQRRFPAAEPRPAARRHAVPGDQSHGAGQRESHQHERRLPAHRAARVLQHAGSAWMKRARSITRSRPSRRSPSSTSWPTRRTTCRGRGTSTIHARRTRRSTSRPTARRPTASRAIRRASTSST